MNPINRVLSLPPLHPSPCIPKAFASSWHMVGHNSRRNTLINMIHEGTTLVAGCLPFPDLMFCPEPNPSGGVAMISLRAMHWDYFPSGVSSHGFCSRTDGVAVFFSTQSSRLPPFHMAWDTIHLLACFPLVGWWAFCNGLPLRVRR